MTSGIGQAGPTEPPARVSPWKIYVVLAVVLVAVAVVNAVSVVDDAARFAGRTLPLPLILLWELSSVLVVFALAPMIRWGALQVRGGGIAEVARAVVVNAGLVVLFSALHVAGMVLLRKLGHAAFGAGPYVFDLSLAKLVYELRKDALTYLLIGSVFWLNKGWADRPQDDAAQADAVQASGAAETGVASATTVATPQAFWLRDGSASIKIDPAMIVWVQSAGNYVEYCLVDGQRHLIRATLRAEEQRLQPFGIIRVHRTRLVNPARIERIEMRPSGDAELKLETGETIAGSRRYGIGETLRHVVRTPGA
ncbi:LytTR family DNA-binding domain-containing protein [Phreatobacter stygius]|uniref:LytTR family DNA-binding domain-containing protein n=1 Tax=Phreatobacter stygius TaxID=1940610 RepID=UPI001476A39F|nr:LytTR family DNA-binding domain-containing protein [Phreatobacter stygius]